MGWFWNSTPSSPAASTGVAASPTPTTPSPSPGRPASGDREVQKFWEMIQEEVQPNQPPQAKAIQTATTPPPPAAKSSSWLSWGRSSDTPSRPAAQTQPEHQLPVPRGARSPESLAMSEALLPTTMSCRDAFDYAWHCHTPGSQWNAVYRYGSVRSCSELWDDFWFCMRTKSFSPEAKAAAVRAHYRAKEEAKYGGDNPSSEDVWESRKEMVPPGMAFLVKFEPPIENDAEFQKADAERRRRIREELGAEGRQQ